MENALTLFKNEHYLDDFVTEYQAYDKFKVLTYKHPDTKKRSFTYIFDEENHNVFIYGAYGTLAAHSKEHMTFDEFSIFSNNELYFKEKIECTKFDILRYDAGIAKEDILQLIKLMKIENIIKNDYIDMDTFCGDVIDEYFDFKHGVSFHGYQKLGEYIEDIDEYIHTIGIYDTGIVGLYLYAFNEAIKQLETKEV